MDQGSNFLFGLLLLVAGATALGFVVLLVFRVVRPSNPGGAKDLIYECGEPTIGPGRIQFDLRFYVLALVFVLFDVEIALLYPWAVVLKDLQIAGLLEMFFFFGLLVVGYIYLLRNGYLDWVRSVGKQTTDQQHSETG